MYYSDTIITPIGKLHVTVSEKGVSRICFPGEHRGVREVRMPKHHLVLRSKRELKEYFLGKRKKFTLPLTMDGTVFQKNVWRALRTVPYGETVSYFEQARKVGKKNAVRAVGSANGRNPIPIIVPCHRVIAMSGGLGGYSGGLAIKKKLLALEQKFSRKT